MRLLVLHAFWSLDDGIGLWAEDSEKTVMSPSQSLKAARPHPFAASTDVITAIQSGDVGGTTLLLPSLRRSPLDSPELVRVIPRPRSSTGPSLLPWTVPVVWVRSAALAATADPDLGAARSGAELASALFPEDFGDDEPTFPGDIRIAHSVRFLGELARFADELAERGRALPEIAWADDGADESPVAEARWRAVLRGADALAFGDLIAATPPAFRSAPGSEDAGELIAVALDALTDAAIRHRLPEDLPILPPRRGRKPLQPRAAEAWLQALRTSDGRIRAPEPALAELEQSLLPWARYARETDVPARATFRLTEASSTEHDSPPWRLEFLLQSSADPSLMVPADQVWRDDGALARWLGRPQEVLLGELGKAARIYPGLESGLRQARPTALDLDADAAFTFLDEAAPALDEAGFGVLLPSWWDRRAKLGLKLSASGPRADDTGAAPSFGRDQLCEFQWSLAVGEHTLTEEEIATLADAKAPLVRLRGQWVTVDSDQLRRGIDFLQRERDEHGTVAEVLRLAATHPDDLDLPLDIAEVSAEGWLGALLEGSADVSIHPVPLPEGFGAILRPYQERGLAWLNFLADLGLGGCLADDMGLGKTIQLLALETTRRPARPEAGPTLLVCPMSLIGNWEAEAAKFAPGLRIHVHHGPDRLRDDGFATAMDGIDLVVTTYATLTRDIELFEVGTWNRVVLDEAQAVKNRHSRAAKAVKRLTADHRIALTGTPVENRLGELWSIMDFLNPGMLGSAELFRSRYAIPIERHGDDLAAQRVRAITRPYLLRRVKTDPAIIDDLPEKIEIKQYYTLTSEQASLYQSVVDDMMDKIEGSDGIERRGNVLAAMAKLKQVCNHPGQLLHDRSAIGQRSGKVIRLEEILEEILAEGDKVLCFTQYTEFAEMLEGLGVGGRLQRGRHYARRGQVVSLDIDAGIVVATVQGSRATPYRVRIGITAFGKAEWAAVEEALAANAWFVATLLAGEMPADIEDVFTAVGLSLFPRGADELSLDCSCPDWEVPCKHLAAVFYLLAERFDDDPFRILAWRGREREDLLGRMHEAGSVSVQEARSGAPLTDVLDVFFVSPAPVPMRRSRPGGALLVDQLPPVDVAVRSRPLAEVLRPVYVALRASTDRP